MCDFQDLIYKISIDAAPLAVKVKVHTVVQSKQPLISIVPDQNSEFIQTNLN